jgi:prepilin-type N-terminal cleavage/methylation domain-containing protein
MGVMEMKEEKNQEREQGFTLIELLIAIVVVGILTAVAIVGIGGLTDNGKTAACQATADAAKAASAVYYANSTTNAFPTTFTQLAGPPVLLDIPSNVTPNAAGTSLTGKGWTLNMAGTGTTAPTFSGCP